jgi:protein-export membrane protein SecD
VRKRNWSLLAVTLVIAYFAACLVLPLTRGESPIDFGLDLAGGVIVSYNPDFSRRLEGYESTPDDELLALTKGIIESRLYRNLNNVPEVVIRDDQQIVVSLPGYEDYRRILDVVGRTYHLTLRLVLSEHDGPVGGKELFPYQGRYLELAPAEFSGDMLDERHIGVEPGDPGAFEPERRSALVTFRFEPPHDEAFAELTGRYVGRELAILLDGGVEWAGTIESAIRGPGVLQGGYSLQEATEVATMLRSGNLPISLEVGSLSAVGPSLGQEMRELGGQALLLSLLLLAALLGFAYLHRRRLLLAGLASLGCLLLLIAGMAAAFELTLDMVGIAGIILSVGMGMDAFILVFESLAGRGRTTRWPAGHHGGVIRKLYSFAGEGRTLFHANATTLVVLLLLFATERLRSFALFMIAGVFASALTIFVTREILQRIGPGDDDAGLDLLGWLRPFRHRLFRLRKLYFAAVLAALTTTAVLLPLSLPAGPSLELGADFEPGTQLVVTGADRDSLEDALWRLGERFPGIEIRRQQLGVSEQQRYLLTLGIEIDDEEAKELDRVFAASPVDLESVNSIDGKVSSRRLLRSLGVLFWSFFFLAAYFALQGPIERLVSSKGMSSAPPSSRLTIFAGVLLAVAIDVAIVLAFAAWLRIPIGLPIVAAVLMIIGYSVNDSVVLWSHLQSRSRGEAGSAVERVTRGVDGILSRAFLTSLSTLVPALTMLAVGLAPLRDFAWVVIVGTVSGTLSSIFVVGTFAARVFKTRRARTAKESAPTVKAPACAASLSE